MTDNGLAALATALEHEGDACSYDAATDSLRCPGSEAHIGLARRLLGERGVFLPEGLGPVMVGMAKEIVALRAALGLLVGDIRDVGPDEPPQRMIPAQHRVSDIGKARLALAEAEETP